MTADELKAKLQARYGRTWRTDAARALGVARMSLWRWCNGRRPVPGPVAAWVKTLRSKA